ncbi:cysteine/Histidine-rich C1 domain family protein [Striga asiatica]|uniref:Cysteine/Histidine-rich C1 domain family protein n=1 Tax=Striga asiatica TaxID=4170 RepID=A0A5A7QVM2_STRAF|nr:cysteine/Histidine-rich C1 domain family protein [Striga asiatica]
MSCTEVEDVQNLATSFENLGRPPTTGMNMNSRLNISDFERGITKLGRSKSLKNLASFRESVGTFSMGTRRKSRSSISLKTLSSTKAASTGYNEVESKLVPSYIPQFPSEVVPSFKPSYAPHYPFFSFHDSAEDKSQPEVCSKCSLEHLPRDSCPFIFSDIYLSKVVPSYVPHVPSEVVPSLIPSYVPDKSFFSIHDGAIDESQPEFCSKCSLEHLPRQACPYISCAICFRTHKNWGCPYENFLPQGADFNRVNCMVVCAFDHASLFDEEKWACTWCHGKIAKLTAKYCCICLNFADHCSYECPKDVDRAASFKALRDYDLTYPKKWVPSFGYVDTCISKQGNLLSYLQTLIEANVPKKPSRAPQNPFFSFHDSAKDKSQPEFCSKCSLEHCPLQACPYISCAICFRTHNSWGCPYEDFLPQGADFDWVNCMAVCAFDGGLIDEEKWACTWCHGKIAKLTAKYPAATFKALRDYDLKFPEKWVPCGDYLAEKAQSKKLLS